MSLFDKKQFVLHFSKNGASKIANSKTTLCRTGCYMYIID